MDETFIKVRGRWVCLYRAVDRAGATVDFFLSRNSDVNAAKAFLRSAMKNTRKRYNSIWSDPARDCWGGGEILTAGSLRIETFEGRRPRLRRTRQAYGC